MSTLDPSALARRLFPEQQPLSSGTGYEIFNLHHTNGLTGVFMLSLAEQFPYFRDRGPLGRFMRAWDGLLARFQARDTEPKLAAFCVVTQHVGLIVDAILVGPMDLVKIVDPGAASVGEVIVAHFSAMRCSEAILNSNGFLPLMEQLRLHGGAFGPTMGIVVDAPQSEMFAQRLESVGCHPEQRDLIEGRGTGWWVTYAIPTLDPHPAG